MAEAAKRLSEHTRDGVRGIFVVFRLSVLAILGVERLKVSKSELGHRCFVKVGNLVDDFDCVGISSTSEQDYRQRVSEGHYALGLVSWTYTLEIRESGKPPYARKRS